MEKTERFDNFYYTMCKETGGIQGLLHTFFSFLIRKTDFYVEMDPGGKMGFAPGKAELMVMQIFKAYQAEYWKKVPRKSKKEYQ